MCDFKVGDEVVCVWAGPMASQWIAEGQIYTVRAVLPFTDITGASVTSPYDGSRYGVRLEGVVAIKASGVEGTFHVRYFRKVQRRNLQDWLSQSVGNTDKLDNRQKVGA